MCSLSLLKLIFLFLTTRTFHVSSYSIIHTKSSLVKPKSSWKQNTMKTSLLKLHTTSSSTSDDETISHDTHKIEQYALKNGITVTLTTLGPGYRAVARAAHDPKQILGYCEGFIRPGGKIQHVDKLEVWKKALDRAKAENPSNFKYGGNPFGVSILLGYMCLLHGKEKGCSIAEFLAIDDEAFQHKRLVRFFKRSGFTVIRYVGDDIASIPDRLVWGGCGTLMNGSIDDLLALWYKILFKNKSI